MRRLGRLVLLTALLAISGWSSANAQPSGAPAPAPPTAEDKTLMAKGEALFDQHCSGCHEPAIEGAPSQADLGNYNPQAIVDILRHGAMQPMAKDLSDADIDAINRFLHAY